MAAILVVDDDRKTVDLIKLYLEHAGFDVCVAYDGERALELVGERAPDLLVLDLMLPKLDGLDVCQALQAVNPVPVIMLTARTTEGDKLAGLESGADDYITKPFSPRELVARVRAVLRRTGTGTGESGEVRVGDLVVDLHHQEARLRGDRIPLTPKEFSLLRILSREPGRPFDNARSGGGPSRSGAPGPGDGRRQEDQPRRRNIARRCRCHVRWDTNRRTAPGRRPGSVWWVRPDNRGADLDRSGGALLELVQPLAARRRPRRRHRRACARRRTVAGRGAFDSSRARATGGAGIGLAVVKQLVEAHGGMVGVRSVVGTGTTFSFTLPLALPV